MFSMATSADAARGLFGNAGLGAPPIPKALEGELLKCGEWHFATRGAPSMSPYNFAAHVAAAKRPEARDSLVLAHAGHGSNSYAISYYLVLGSIRVLLQLEWGGVYMDPETTSARIRDVFAMLERHLPALEAACSSGPVRVFDYSDFYSEPALSDAELEAAIVRLGDQRAGANT